MKCVLFVHMDKLQLKNQNILKNTGKIEKYTGKVGEFCQSGKLGTMLMPLLVPSHIHFHSCTWFTP